MSSFYKDYPMSHAQKRLYILDQFDNAGIAYNIPAARIIEGRINRISFEKAFQELIRRHEALRTSFAIVDGEPVQRVHDEVDFNVIYFESTDEEAEALAKKFIKPFDLCQAPLLRIGLVKIREDRHLMLFDMHHIISDGTSMGLLVQEFIKLYDGKELPKLRIQYKDYSVWQNEVYAGDFIKNQENYWLETFKGKIPVFNMPLDYPRPAIQSFDGDRINFEIGKELTGNLNKIAKDCGATLYMILLAAFNALLFKYTGQEDIVVGSPIAGRPHVDLQGIIGMFVNTLAMRNYPEGGKTFSEFLNEVKENALDAYENQDYQFEELIEKLDLNRDLSRNPLFDVMFTLQNMNMADFELEGLKFTPYEGQFLIAKFDMTLYATETDGGIAFELEYNTKLFKEETVQRLEMHYVNILEQVTGNSGITLKDIDVLTEEEKKTILFDFNDTQTKYPNDKTIPELFEEQVEKTPDNIAVVFEDEQLTYRKLNEKVNRLANYLRIEHNIMPDSFVGIVMERSLEMIVGILGVLKAGGAYVPIDPDYPFERIKSIVNDSGVNVVVSTQKQLKLLNKLQWECKKFNTFICMDIDDVNLPENPENHEFMDKKLWEYVANTATNDIGAGGWTSSYTGEEFSEMEMAEYADNTLEKLKPYLNINTRVLEVGCASGLSMYKIAPHVSLYCGTDLSNAIIEKNNQRILDEIIENIRLSCLSAHEIDKLESNEFDVIIINSVIQCFPGYNYLKDVISKSISLLSSKGILYIGDVMDHDLKSDLIKSLTNFKINNPEYRNKTKTDFSNELFVSRDFFEDLQIDYPEISAVEFSGKNYTIENELTEFRYDCIIQINKTQKTGTKSRIKHKNQHGMSILNKYNTNSPYSSSRADNLAYVMYTSGSTGKPKGVMTTHRNIVRVVKNTNYIDITDEDVLLQLSNYAFDGSTFDIFGALLNGAKLVLIDKESVIDMIKLPKLIIDAKISVLFITTALFNVIVDMNIQCLENIRKVLFGGERVSMEHVEKAFNILGKDRLIHMYGPTENTVFTTYYPINKIDLKLGTVPIGSPISNTQVFVLGDGSSMQPIGVPGELCIREDGLARGYLNNPELTAEKFVDNPFLPGEKMYRTGDLVKWLPDGNIEFLERMDNQVKIRGFRIELGEIENHLLKHSQVKETIVLAKEDQDNNKYLYAYILGEGKLTTDQLRDYISKDLPDYMIPSYFIQLEEMPLTPNGKIDRKALPEPQGIINMGIEYVAPKNKKEEILVKVWKDVLKVERVGLKDNFFSLGGDSIKAIQVLSRLNNYGLKLELRHLFENPIIEELSIYVENASRKIKQDIIQGEVNLTPIQNWLFKQKFEDKNHFNQAVMLYNKEKFDENVIKRLLKKLVEHHDALRMVFRTQGEKIIQYNKGLAGELYSLKVIELTNKENYHEKIEKEANIIQRSLDLENGPLIKLGLFKTGEGDYLLIVIHHLVVDGVSWRIILEDFATGYIQALNDEEIKFTSKTDSFKDWSNELSIYANSNELLKELDYWRKLEKSDINPIIKDRAIEERKFRDNTSIRIELTEKETEKLLKKTNNAYNTEINDILLTSLGLAVKEWTEEDKILINMEGHGREAIIKDIDITRTVGWFTSQYPIILDMGGDKDISYRIKSVKEIMRQIPNKGINYGILKYLTSPENKKDLNFNRKPEINFNYLGQFDMDLGKIDISGISTGEMVSPDKSSNYSIDVNGMIMNQKLILDFMYNNGEYEKITIGKLTESFKKNIIGIIEHCAAKNNSERTPSDFTESNIKFEDLEYVLNKFE
jgi:amino acid adenylation domain-containing protein/non-ribosomal peptide synthase protein (TIGR01720 family)